MRDALKKLVPRLKSVGPFLLFGGAIAYVLGRSPSAPTGDAIPTYAVVAATDEAAPATRLHLSRGRDSRFGLALQPSSPPATKIVVYAFSFSDASADAEPNPIDARFDVGGDGVVRITGSARPLEGAKELRLVIGAPSAFAKFDDAATRARSARTDAFVQVIAMPIDRE